MIQYYSKWRNAWVNFQNQPPSEGELNTMRRFNYRIRVVCFIFVFAAIQAASAQPTGSDTPRFTTEIVTNDVPFMTIYVAFLDATGHAATASVDYGLHHGRKVLAYGFLNQVTDVANNWNTAHDPNPFEGGDLLVESTRDCITLSLYKCWAHATFVQLGYVWEKTECPSCLAECWTNGNRNCCKCYLLIKDPYTFRKIDCLPLPIDRIIPRARVH